MPAIFSSVRYVIFVLAAAALVAAAAGYCPNGVFSQNVPMHGEYVSVIVSGSLVGVVTSPYVYPSSTPVDDYGVCRPSQYYNWRFSFPGSYAGGIFAARVPMELVVDGQCASPNNFAWGRTVYIVDQTERLIYIVTFGADGELSVRAVSYADSYYFYYYYDGVSNVPFVVIPLTKDQIDLVLKPLGVPYVSPPPYDSTWFYLDDGRYMVLEDGGQAVFCNDYDLSTSPYSSRMLAIAIETRWSKAVYADLRDRTVNVTEPNRIYYFKTGLFNVIGGRGGGGSGNAGAQASVWPALPTWRPLPAVPLPPLTLTLGAPPAAYLVLAIAVFAAAFGALARLSLAMIVAGAIALAASVFLPNSAALAAVGLGMIILGAWNKWRQESA